jgi:hypothetical protein
MAQFVAFDPHGFTTTTTPPVAKMGPTHVPITSFGRVPDFSAVCVVEWSELQAIVPRTSVTPERLGMFTVGRLANSGISG